MTYSIYTAKLNKKDEFYTRLEDIEKELFFYRENLKGKVIYCNTDYPSVSSFWRHFCENFHSLKLKKLVSTFRGEFPVKTEYDGSAVTSFLLQDGDFRGKECLEILQEADVIVTNPPFSLFREFVSLLRKYGKDFIIIGNTQALAYSSVFRMFMDGTIRTGYTNFNKGMWFSVPSWYEKYTKEENGKKFVRVSTSCWYTSFPVKKEFSLESKIRYSPELFPSYHNYDAIHIDNIQNIPCDYNGIMGVPLTFLDKFDPERFELLGLSSKGNSERIPRLHENSYYDGYHRGKVKTRIESNLPILAVPDFGGTVCHREGSPDLWQMYWRVFVRRK